MRALTRTGWVIGLRGVSAVGFGLAALLWPILTFRIACIAFGAFAITDGILAVAAALAASDRKDLMRASLVDGSIKVIIGLIAVTAPNLTGSLLAALIAVGLMSFGLFEVFTIDKANRVTLSDWPLVLFGVLAFCVGAVLLLNPLAPLRFLMMLVGCYALTLGLLLLNTARRWYNHEHRTGHPPNHAPAAP